MKIICDVYKSVKDPDMYLYVKKSDGLSKVPAELLERFGKHKQALTMVLTPERKLARITVEQLVEQLEIKGFYLQLPPPPEAYMQTIHEQNSKLSR